MEEKYNTEGMKGATEMRKIAKETHKKRQERINDEENGEVRNN